LVRLPTKTRHGSSACVLALLLFVAVGCDAFSFPAPVRAKEQDGSSGAAAKAAVSQLGDPCRSSTGCDVGPRGEPMTCVPASVLGGNDFCAPSCTSGSPAPEGQVCTQWGALLPGCHPSQHTAAAADCPDGLNCYRTSLSEDQGVCIDMPVCKTNGDCHDLVHSTCASTVVPDVVGPLVAALNLDHLNCLKRDCLGQHSDCPASESCLASQYDKKLADICVPICREDTPCPPNYSCLRTALDVKDRYVGFCMPGLPGILCEPGGCVGGTCEDTGAGFKACAIDCETTENCRGLNSAYDSFVCVEGGGHRHCVTPRAFHGTSCQDDGDCPQDLNEFCSLWVPRGRDDPPGNCRQRCSPDLTCSPRGGLPHTCLWDGLGGCYPGTQGLPCHLDSECIEGLSCLNVPAEPDVGTEPARICTQRCDDTDPMAGDDFCNKQNDIHTGGYCASGFCRARRFADETCSRDAQCVGWCENGRCR